MRVETPKEVRERESTVTISTAPVTIIIQHLLEQSSSNCANDKFSQINLVHLCLIITKTHSNCYSCTKNQLFDLLSINLLYWIHRAKIPIHFELGMKNVSLQLASTMRRACVIMSAMVKYGRITVLGAFDIKYLPRTSVKGQVVANLVAEFTEPPLEEVAATQCMDEESIGTISL